jgi:hypothetical protein
MCLRFPWQFSTQKLCHSFNYRNGHNGILMNYFAPGHYASYCFLFNLKHELTAVSEISCVLWNPKIHRHAHKTL